MANDDYLNPHGRLPNGAPFMPVEEVTSTSTILSAYGLSVIRYDSTDGVNFKLADPPAAGVMKFIALETATTNTGTASWGILRETTNASFGPTTTVGDGGLLFAGRGTLILVSESTSKWLVLSGHTTAASNFGLY